MIRKLLLVVGVSFVPLLLGTAGEPVSPAPPDKYDVKVRFRIDAFENDRIVQHAEMMKYLNRIGFVRDPGPDDEAENRTITRMTGTIASRDARKLLNERHIRSLLLIPSGGKLPTDAKALVRVQIDLVRGFPADRQLILEDQVREVLIQLGLKEAVGYDNRGHSRLMGMFPPGKLDMLLEDLRKTPEGKDLPAPFSKYSPILVTEVQLNLPETKDRPAVPKIPKGQEKLTPDLRVLVATPAEAAKPTRMEVILSVAPQREDVSWIQTLEEAAEVAIEGKLGPLVTLVGKPSQAAALAALPNVDVVRVARNGQHQSQTLEGAGTEPSDHLKSTGLDRLHKLGHKGRGVRLAIVDGDFRGWKELVGKKLPAKTRYIDLTAERNANLLPDPFPPAQGGAVGNGCRVALAALVAAPEVNLTLIRIDPECPYQLYQVAQYINGEAVGSINQDNRRKGLAETLKKLEVRREALRLERQKVFDEFSGDEESKKMRDAYLQKQEQLEKEENAHHDTEMRLLDQKRDLLALKATQVVVSSIVWREGQPLVGDGPLSRYLDDHPFKAAIWLQSSGDAEGQTWQDLYRDQDGNGVMEFAPAIKRLPPERWTRELNFLAWQPDKGAKSTDLPAKAKIRLSIQWQEPHDPELWGREDHYRQPLVNPGLVLVRQRDPAGKKEPADDLEVLGQSVGLPQRLMNQQNAGVYEQTLEVEVPQAGRYALRVELKDGVPASIRPKSVPTLPIMKKTWELRPRIFLETLNGPGRAVWLDYATPVAASGVPANAQGAITVDFANEGIARRPRGLTDKPELLSFDPFHEANLASATGFAGGWAAATISAGATPIHFLKNLDLAPAKPLRVPEWLPSRK